jgi:hypothetical protein
MAVLTLCILAFFRDPERVVPQDPNEIAAAVDMTEENVRQTLSRARKQIRETYKNIN